MSAELLVNVAPFETRIARIENGLAEEIYIERERERGLKGNIYKGRVQRVLPGIQAAFVDIGLAKAGFLYAGDISMSSDSDTALNGADQEEDGEAQADKDVDSAGRQSIHCQDQGNVACHGTLNAGELGKKIRHKPCAMRAWRR